MGEYTGNNGVLLDGPNAIAVGRGIGNYEV